MNKSEIDLDKIENYGNKMNLVLKELDGLSTSEAQRCIDELNFAGLNIKTSNSDLVTSINTLTNDIYNQKNQVSKFVQEVGFAQKKSTEYFSSGNVSINSGYSGNSSSRIPLSGTYSGNSSVGSYSGNSSVGSYSGNSSSRIPLSGTYSGNSSVKSYSGNSSSRTTSGNSSWGTKVGGGPYSGNATSNSPIDISKYSDKELADMVIRGEFGAGETRKKALGNRYSNVQKIVNQRMSGSAQTATKQTTTTTSVKETSTGANTTKTGTSSELEKRLKEKEVELENAEIAKRRAIAAESEAQDKLNRAKAEQKELDKKMAKLASEKEDAQIEAEQLKTENEELRKKLEEKTTPIKVEPQPEPTPEPQPEPTPEPQPEPTPEPQPEPTPQPEPQPTPQPQAQPRTYTETQVSQPAASQTPPVEVKPSEQPVVEEPKPATEVQPTTPKQDTGSSLPNPNAGSTDTGTGSSSSSKGSSVVPIAVGLGAAVAGGIGIKAIHDHRKNSKFDDQNEDSVTNGNRFWTEEDPNVIHTEEDLFNDESASDSENVSYQAVENNTDNSDTWNIEESEISDDNTFDLLSENN